MGLSAREMYKDHAEIIRAIEKGFEGQEIHEEYLVGGLYIENFIAPYYNREQEIIGVIGVSIDISERKKAELELARSQKFAEAVMASAPG